MNGEIYRSEEQRRIPRMLPELLRARELLLDLVWKDLRVRYRYAAMGFLWAVLEPLALMLVLTFVFTVVFADKVRLAATPDGPPFAVMLLCGLVFWQFLAGAMSNATHSLTDNDSLVKKVAFPREVIPLAALGYPLVNLCIGFGVLLAVHVLYFHGPLGLAVLWFPVVFVIEFVLATGLALLLSCAHVHYRDVGYIVGVGTMFGFYASPVFYPLEFVLRSDTLPPWALRLYLANPMAELLTAYRQLLFELRFPDLWLLVWPSVVAVASLAAGIVLFRRTGPTLSDHL